MADQQTPWTACHQNDPRADQPLPTDSRTSPPPPPTSGGSDELKLNTADLRADHHLWGDWAFKKTSLFLAQNSVGNMLVRKFSFAPIEAKIQQLKSYCYPIYGCALWHHSFQNFIRKLTVSYSDTFKRLINVPRYTSSSLAFAMNATDHINVVFRKFDLQLDEQSNSLPQQHCHCHCQ